MKNELGAKWCWICSKLGERPTILDSHADKVLKNFIDQSETKRCTKKSDPMFRCTTPSTGKRLGVRSRRWYTTLV